MKSLFENLETLKDARTPEEVYSLLRFQFPGLVADLAQAYNFLHSDMPDAEKIESFFTK